MTHKKLSWQAALPVLLLALSANAHDHSKHGEGDEHPDCAKMEDMDHSKMDMDDSTMQAMRKKCKEKMHRDGGSRSEHHHKHHKHDENDNGDSSSDHEH